MEEIEGLNETLFKIGISDWFRIFTGYLREGEKGAAKEIIRSLEKKGKLNEFKEFINNSIASDFGLFWENLNKDPEKEVEQKLIEKRIPILSDIDKILEERQRASLVEYKLLGIFPRKKLVMNPGREFFDELSPYASEAFKELKKMRPGDKVLEAMEKEYNAYRTSRKKKIALSLLGVIAGSLAGYAIYNYFKEDRSPPAIHSVNYKFIPPNKISIAVNATDSSGVEKVLAEVQGKNYSLPLINGVYSANITDGLISEIENLPIKIYAFDKLNNCVKKELVAVPNLKEKFLSLALANQVPEQKAENFYSSYLELIQEAFPKNPSLLIPTLKLYSANSTVFNELYRNISLDPQITMNRKELLSLASQLFLDLGYDKKVKVLIPGTNNYREEFLNEKTIQLGGNCSVAIFDKKYPMLPREAFFNGGNATQLDPQIADFSSVILVGSDGKKIDLWKDHDKVYRQYYTLVIDLMQSPYVLNKPESFEFFNGLLRQHNFVLYDVLKLDPTNQTVRLIYVKPDIDYYYLFLPSKKIVVNGTEINFPLLPLLNKTRMEEWFPNKEDRMVIYASQYPVQLCVFDAKNGKFSGEVGGLTVLKDNLELIWNGGKWGKFEGKLINRIIKAYTDKNWKSYGDTPQHREYFTGESDYELARAGYSNHFTYSNNWEGEFQYTFNQFNIYDKVLSQDRIIDLGFRFIYGLTGYVDSFGIPHQYRIYLNQLYSKALGYAMGEIIAPYVKTTIGAVHEESTFPIPKFILEILENNSQTYGKPLILPGQMLSLYCDKVSLKKDSIPWIEVILPTVGTLKITI